MGGIRAKTRSLYALEQLAEKQTVVHRLHPLVKLLATAVYLLCLLSGDRYALGSLAPFLFYPVLVLSLGEIPIGMVVRRSLVVLPFCLFTGLGNLVLERQVLFCLGPLPVTAGLVSFLTILLRAVLSAAAVLTLVAITPFPDLTSQLRRLHLPAFLVALTEMTYRYVGVLLDEGASMTTAYALRAPQRKALEMRHMGPFLGSLLLRSVDRAERIYHAMACRGFGGDWHRASRQPFRPEDWIFLLLSCGSAVLFRVVDIPGWLGGILTCWR